MRNTRSTHSPVCAGVLVVVLHVVVRLLLWDVAALARARGADGLRLSASLSLSLVASTRRKRQTPLGPRRRHGTEVRAYGSLAKV